MNENPFLHFATDTRETEVTILGLPERLDDKRWTFPILSPVTKAQILLASNTLSDIIVEHCVRSHQSINSPLWQTKGNTMLLDRFPPSGRLTEIAGIFAAGMEIIITMRQELSTGRPHYSIRTKLADCMA
jgi:hypothetical protein